MSLSSDEIIQQALKAGKAGDKEAAKNLLTRIIKQDPKNPRAWYLLSQAVDQKEHAIYCLEQVQKLYPDNEKVKQRLLKLKVPNDVELVEEQHAAPVETKEVSIWKTSASKPQNIILVVIGISFSLCIACLLCVGFQNFIGGDVEPKSTNVAQVTDTLPPTQISWAIDRPEQPEPAPA